MTFASLHLRNPHFLNTIYLPLPHFSSFHFTACLMIFTTLSLRLIYHFFSYTLADFWQTTWRYMQEGMNVLASYWTAFTQESFVACYLDSYEDLPYPHIVFLYDPFYSFPTLRQSTEADDWSDFDFDLYAGSAQIYTWGHLISWIKLFVIFFSHFR